MMSLKIQRKPNNNKNCHLSGTQKLSTTPKPSNQREKEESVPKFKFSTNNNERTPKRDSTTAEREGKKTK